MAKGITQVRGKHAKGNAGAIANVKEVGKAEDKILIN